MKTHDFELTSDGGLHKRFGLIVLQMDERVENDFRRLFSDPHISLQFSRIPSDQDITPETLRAMEGQLTRTASLFPTGIPFDAVGYGCTSGATMIGSPQVAQLVKAGMEAHAVTDPLNALLAALDHLKIRRLALLTPYIASVTGPMQGALESAGIEVSDVLSFGISSESKVVRISPESVYQAAISIGAAPEVDAVFMSCTNLNTLDVIDRVEQTLGKPALSSNQVLAWHMAQLAGYATPSTIPGRLAR